VSIKYSIPEKFQKNIGKITEALTPLLTDKRLQRMRHVVSTRSRKVCAVFENTHHAHNISAVLRTMDAFGFLDVFFLYNNPHIRFRAHDSIDRSASKWLMIRNQDSVATCAQVLKENNYKIALISRPDFSKTSKYYQMELPAFSTAKLDERPFLELQKNHDIALVFGTELYGVSEEWTQYADFYLSVDMYGFCESLNVSVCAGIVLNSLRDSLSKHSQLPLLSEFERSLLLEHWMIKDLEISHKYIRNKHKDLCDWYDFIKTAKFLTSQ